MNNPLFKDVLNALDLKRNGSRHEQLAEIERLGDIASKIELAKEIER